MFNTVNHRPNTRARTLADERPICLESSTHRSRSIRGQLSRLSQLASLAISLSLLATSAPAGTIYVDPDGSLDAGVVSLGEWNTNGNTDGWSTKNLGSRVVTGGAYYGEPTSNDPQIYKYNFSSTKSIDINSGNFDFIEFRLQRSESFGNAIQLFWGTTAINGFSEALSIRIAKSLVPEDGEFHTYLVDLSDDTDWTGMLDDFRVDPISSPDAIGFPLALDYLRVGNFTFTPLSVPVPEPSSLILLGLGVAGFSISRRRRANRRRA